MSRVVSWFSCGAASAVATKLAIAQSDEPITIAYCEVLEEHPDNKRFMADCAKWFGQDIVVLGNDKYGRSIYEVFEKTKFLKGPSGARCTGELKKAVRKEFEKPGDRQILGFTIEEEKRLNRFIDSNNEVDVWPILIEQGLTKQDCLAILNNAGIDLPVMYKLGYQNNNCLAGETKIITEAGPVELKSIVNIPTSIRTSEGFEVATVKDYGLQQCYEVDISRDGMVETIVASYNHRWFVRPRRYRDELVVVPTLALQEGFKIPTAYKGACTNPSDEGIRHGIVYGDGAMMGSKSGVKLIGEKMQLASYFPNYNGEKGCISGQPAHYKVLPSISESIEYKAGFAAGLLTTDGCFKDGVTLSQAKDMVEIKAIFESIGLSVQPIKTIEGSTNFSAHRELHTLRIISASLPIELDLRNQRKNFRENHRADDATITRVEKIGNKRVYCPTTTTTDIALEYGIVTGQCIGCVKGEAGYWNKIRVDFPETFARMTEMEEKLGRTVCKREWTENGERKIERIPLKELPPDLGDYGSELNTDCGIFCMMAEDKI